MKNVHGCGLLTACRIIVEIIDVQRFNTDAKLAKYAGIAPLQSQSGKKNRYYTNPFGNRKLNNAVNTIVLSQIRGVGTNEGRVYYEKKLAEGKTKLWAMRCLKRFVIRRITESYYNKTRDKLRAKQKTLQEKLGKLQIADEEYYLTSDYILDLAKRAPELYESSEPIEKRQLLKFTLQNLQLEGSLALYDEIKPFDAIRKYAMRQAWLRD